MNVVEDVGEPGGCAQVIAQVAYSIGTYMNILKRISLDIWPAHRSLWQVYKGVGMMLAMLLFILRYREQRSSSFLVIGIESFCVTNIMNFC